VVKLSDNPLVAEVVALRQLAQDAFALARDNEAGPDVLQALSLLVHRCDLLVRFLREGQRRGA
jgi:hypothetical protein